MFKMKNVTVINSMEDFYANVSAEMLQEEDNIKIHFEGSNEILVMYYFDNEYVIDVIDTDTYLNINCLSVRNFYELLEEVEGAYGLEY